MDIDDERFGSMLDLGFDETKAAAPPTGEQNPGELVHEEETYPFGM